MQCMAGAMTAVGAASGTRAYLSHRRFLWLTPRRLRAITIALVVAALAASATFVNGSSPADQGAAQNAAHAAQR
jgi:hypothetical protein